MPVQKIAVMVAASLMAAAMIPCGGAAAGPLSLDAGNTRAISSSGIRNNIRAGELDMTTPLKESLQRKIVDYPTKFAPGTIVIDTPHTYLYYVLGGGQAIRYGIGVGREGFTWSGTETVSRMAEWPDWIPPPEMIARQPYLPRFMSGGPGNPLGARAIYLGNTMYRIHGTNAPDTIGHRVSSGCIRMLNADVIDLFSRVDIGTRVVVLPAHGHTPSVAAMAGPQTKTRSASNVR